MAISFRSFPVTPGRANRFNPPSHVRLNPRMGSGVQGAWRMRAPSEPTDEALLLAWQAGDPSVFEVLFRRWQAPLHRHLTRMLDDPAAADDLVMETFLRLQRHRTRWRPG